MKGLFNNHQGWGAVSILLHWLTAIAVFGMFILGLWMSDLEYYNQWYKLAPFTHKSIGILLLLLMIFRVFWRVFNITPEPLSSHTKTERILSHLMHIALYILLFCIFVSGYLISTADGRAISVFDWFEVPSIITAIPKQEDIAGEIHFYLACTVIGFASLHAMAAIKHHFIDKDKTLKRMLGI